MLGLHSTPRTHVRPRDDRIHTARRIHVYIHVFKSASHQFDLRFGLLALYLEIRDEEVVLRDDVDAHPA